MNKAINRFSDLLKLAPILFDDKAHHARYSLSGALINK
jgi:hypothetical protein